MIIAEFVLLADRFIKQLNITKLNIWFHAHVVLTRSCLFINLKNLMD